MQTLMLMFMYGLLLITIKQLQCNHTQNKEEIKRNIYVKFHSSFFWLEPTFSILLLFHCDGTRNVKLLKFLLYVLNWNQLKCEDQITFTFIKYHDSNYLFSFSTNTNICFFSVPLHTHIYVIITTHYLPHHSWNS